MNEEEDEFFVEPEIEEVRDIKPIQEPNLILDKQIPQEPKHITLKMVEAPKPEETYTYKPFHFEAPDSEEEDEEEAHFDYDSPFTEYYEADQCVYMRHWNKQFNRVNQTTYFAGCFLHQNIFQEGNGSDTSEISQVARVFYDETSRETVSPPQGSLVFDSRFQSGNLFAAFQVGDRDYDLVMSNDTNSTGNNQWFYFSVEGMQVDTDYTFNVVNFTKNDALFNYGMAPAIYSMAENKGTFGLDKGWRREGREVSYKKGPINRENSRRMYYKLTFKLSTLFENDKVFIAHSYPYSLEKLNRFLYDKTVRNKEVVTRVTIGRTLSRRNIEALVIAAPANKKRDTRKAIFIMARQHPGECQGSYVCEGVVERLLSKAKEADFLLKNYIIHVVPMVNIDGVVFGHYRTNLSGKDLNRKWNITERDTSCPEVIAVKNYIQQVSRQRDIRFILDLHGHSKKFNSFFYGNPCPQNPDVVRIFPYTCSKLHPGVQYMDCTFASEEYKRKAARVFLSFLYRLIHVYTFESSFFAYFKDGRRVEFTPKEYRDLGATLINALYMQLEHEVRFQQSFEFNFKKNNNKEFMSSPFVRLISELKNNRELLEWGAKDESGSDSKPQQGQIPEDKMEAFKPLVRPLSTKTQDPKQESIKTTKTSRKAARETSNRQYSFNKPIRNIKFLEISRVNSILPDKYQLGLQPIKKKETVPEIGLKPPVISRAVASAQTEPKTELRSVEFRLTDIENCVLSNSVKVDPAHERKFSSVIRSNNRNIIFKFDIFGRTTTRQEDIKPNKAPLIYKQAYSQTMITYSREQGERIKASQMLPQVEPQDELKWARSNSIRAEGRAGSRREAELFFNGMVKKLMVEKERADFPAKQVSEKPLSIKKKQIYKK